MLENLHPTEYMEKALKTRKEIGDTKGEAADYGNLGALFHSLGEWEKAKEYTEKALAVKKGNWRQKGRSS